MKKCNFSFWCLMIWVMSSCTQKIYVVRHAEKAQVPEGSMMTSDVKLSEAGEERAQLLKQLLLHKGIRHIYSTQTIRTTTTAKPLSEALALPVKIYNHRDTLPQFASGIKRLKGNVLIVGHSNTVDDIVNSIAGKQLVPGDLPETVYDRFYELRVRKRKVKLKQHSFGKVYP